MLKPTNFSDRFTKAMSGFQKAHDELSCLQADISAETKQTEQHLAKLQQAQSKVSESLTNLAPFVTAKK